MANHGGDVSPWFREFGLRERPNISNAYKVFQDEAWVGTRRPYPQESWGIFSLNSMLGVVSSGIDLARELSTRLCHRWTWYYLRGWSTAQGLPDSRVYVRLLPCVV